MERKFRVDYLWSEFKYSQRLSATESLSEKKACWCSGLNLLMKSVIMQHYQVKNEPESNPTHKGFLVERISGTDCGEYIMDEGANWIFHPFPSPKSLCSNFHSPDPRFK